jgi:hypothetical protein
MSGVIGPGGEDEYVTQLLFNTSPINAHKQLMYEEPVHIRDDHDKDDASVAMRFALFAHTKLSIGRDGCENIVCVEG